MDLHSLISQRRSIKHFNPDHRLSEQETEQLLRDAMMAPTSFNIQHWRFVLVNDPALRSAIRSAAWDQAQVTEASALFVITADTQAWQKQPERYWQNADSDKQAMAVSMLTEFYQDREWIQRDEAIRSGAFAAQNMMLSAKAMGYDSCPMIGFDQEQVAELIDLPKDHVIVMLLAVGQSVAQAWPRGGQLPLQDVLIENRFA